MSVDRRRLEILELVIKHMLKLYPNWWRHTECGKNLLHKHKIIRKKFRNYMTDSTYYIE